MEMYLLTRHDDQVLPRQSASRLIPLERAVLSWVACKFFTFDMMIVFCGIMLVSNVGIQMLTISICMRLC